MSNELNQIVLFDWLEFTFFDKKVVEENVELDPDAKTVSSGYRGYDWFTYFFGIKPGEVYFENRSFYGYDFTYSYGNIKLLVSARRPEMGLHLMMSGQACREFEQFGIPWSTFLEKAMKYGAQFTRVDVAIDDFTNDYFTLSKIRKYVREGRVVSKFRMDYETVKRILEDGSINSETIQFGSRASMLQIVFYNKLLERKNANYVVQDNIRYWYRCELRFRQERATLLIRAVIESKLDDLNIVVKGVLRNYIKFCDKSPIDPNRSRWSESKWWTDYLENLDTIKLTCKHPEPTITRKKAWLDHSVSLSQFEVFMATLENVSPDDSSSSYLYDFLMKGSEKIDYDSLKRINDYRRIKGMSTFTMAQLRDYINDVKEILVVKGNNLLD